MAEIGKRIKQRREELGLTQEELATKLGYKNKSTIAKIECGKNDITQSKVVEFANVLGTSIAFLMGWDDREKTKSFSNIQPISLKKLPVLGKIACGEPIFADQNRESYVLAGTDVKADFCLIAQGDSMSGARIYNGDIVFIRKQDTVENGEIAAVVIDDEATLKRVFYYSDKDLLILKAENPKYHDMIYQNEELETIRVLGKAVAFQSDVK